MLGGFSTAICLIHTSFQNWKESPVTTSIETLSISEIKLPKVTVCPPKNTYTNLNYDLMVIKNISLDNYTRNELAYYAIDMIQNHNLKEVMFNISQLEEENRFSNWYKGYTNIDLPYWGSSRAYKGPCSEANCLIQQLSTKATSGAISMKYLGDKFDVNKIETNLFYILQFHPPVKQKKNESITLHFEIEKTLMEGFDKFSDTVENQITTLTRNITPPDNKAFMFLREMSMDQLLREA